MPPPDPDARSDALAGTLGRVALGDRAAFGELYRATSAHLFGVILRIVTDRAAAEDLLQEVYVNLWRAAEGFDPARSSPIAWLTSIARHKAIDGLRRRKTEVRTVATAVGGDDEPERDLLAEWPADAPGPLERLLEAAERRRIAHCVGRLSAEQQQCIALAYYLGLTHGEIARHLAQPLGTVKSWVRRALLALRDCLAAAAG